MATISTTHTAHRPGGRFSQTRADLRQRYEAWKVYRRTLNELDQLGDRELADLGLHRSAIRGIALDAAYGK